LTALTPCALIARSCPWSTPSGSSPSLPRRSAIDLAQLSGVPATVQATLHYQATPPFFLQDRFCTSRSQDTQQLYFLAGHLNLEGTQAEDWKLAVVSTGKVAVPGP
jgi:hypothetical protein